MFIQYFCLECEQSFQDNSGEEKNCPYCGSPNVMEDSSTDDYNGHFEGDLHNGYHGDSGVGDD